MGPISPVCVMTPAAEISVLASVGLNMRENADLASSRWLKPYPKWHFFSGGPPWLGNGWPKPLDCAWLRIKKRHSAEPKLPNS